MKYILASASPRRKNCSEKTGISFEIMPSSKEEVITEELPADVVTELAYQKAADIFSLYHKIYDEDFTVIGADTVVSYKDEILGKPADEQEALDMLYARRPYPPGLHRCFTSNLEKWQKNNTNFL